MRDGRRTRTRARSRKKIKRRRKHESQTDRPKYRQTEKSIYKQSIYIEPKEKKMAKIVEI